MSASSGPAATGSGDGRRQTLVILGAQGDLTSRKLLPGLGGVVAASSERDLVVIGSGRRDWSDEQWRSVVADAFAAGHARGRRSLR